MVPFKEKQVRLPMVPFKEKQVRLPMVPFKREAGQITNGSL